MEVSKQLYDNLKLMYDNLKHDNTKLNQTLDDYKRRFDKIVIVCEKAQSVLNMGHNIRERTATKLFKEIDNLAKPKGD